LISLEDDSSKYCEAKTEEAEDNIKMKSKRNERLVFLGYALN